LAEATIAVAESGVWDEPDGAPTGPVMPVPEVIPSGRAYRPGG
jgi:hypothetical protein